MTRISGRGRPFLKQKGLFLLSLLFLLPALDSFPQKHSPQTVSDCLDKASLLKEKMKYTEAIQILKDKIGETSEDEYKFFLAKLYYLNGEGLKAFRILRKMRQKNWQVYLYLGLILEEWNKKEKALEYYQQSLSLQKNSIALYRIGKLYYQRQNYLKAIHSFLELIKLDPGIRLANYYLGECLYRVEDYQKAYTYLVKGITFYPENKKVQEAFTQVKNKLGRSFFLELKKIIQKARETIRLTFLRRDTTAPIIRVGIAQGLSKISFRCGENFLVTDNQKSFRAKKEKFYTVVFKNNALFLTDYHTGFIYGKFSSPLFLQSENYPFHVLDIVSGKGNYWQKQSDRLLRGNLELKVSKGKLILINTLTIEEYLYGVLPAEIPSSSSGEALKAQAVAARTIAFKQLGRHKQRGFDVCAETHCQVYGGLNIENPFTNQAIDLTRGEILIYQKEPIDALYHANCGGCLRSDGFTKRDYFLNKFDSKSKPAKNLSPYLEEKWFSNPTFFTFCADDKSSFRWQRLYDREDFLMVFGYELEKLKAIVPEKKADCFHYDALSIITQEKSIKLEGDLAIRNYLDKLRSNAFKVEIKFSKNKKPLFLFLWGAGFGHGVGLCQEGAINMAKEGFDYKQILQHYYPQASIKKYY